MQLVTFRTPGNTSNVSGYGEIVSVLILTLQKCLVY